LEEFEADRKFFFEQGSGDNAVYEDFRTGIFSHGWVFNNVSQNGYDLEFIPTAATKVVNILEILQQSHPPLVANGFASLRSDFYNTPPPSGGIFLNMAPI